MLSWGVGVQGPGQIGGWLIGLVPACMSQGRKATLLVPLLAHWWISWWMQQWAVTAGTWSIQGWS